MTERSTIDLKRTLDEAHWTPTHVLVVVLGFAALMVDGLANNMIAVVIPVLVQEWKLPLSSFVPMVAVGTSGMVAGTLAGGMLGDIFGRRPLVLGSVALFSAMTMLASLVSNPFELTLVRFFDGLGLGSLFAGITALITEYAPVRRRSLAVGTMLIGPAVGVFSAGLLGASVLASINWQTYFLVVGVSGFTLLGILFFFLEESPHFLAAQPGSHARLARLLRRLGCALPSDARFVRSKPEKSRMPVLLLLQRKYRQDTLSLWFVLLLTQFIMQVLATWMPTLMSMSGADIVAASWSLTAMALGGILAGPTSGLLFESYGSRKTLAGASAGAALGALALILVPINADNMNFFLAAIMCENFLVMIVLVGLYSLVAQIYPAAMRSSGVGAGLAFARAGQLLSAFGVLALTVEDSRMFFWMLSACSAAITIPILFGIRNHIAPLRT